MDSPSSEQVSPDKVRLLDRSDPKDPSEDPLEDPSEDPLEEAIVRIESFVCV
jgi:hypothetical protein